MADWQVPGYTQLTVLGEGGFGRVVLARQDRSGHVVAIKYLTATDEPARAQFRHEAAILQRVVSPHVARLYEFAETPHGAAIVMEAVPGVSLKDVLARQGALSPESALVILKGSLLGLAAAHAAGTVHRDYKPGNVLVQPDHQSKLVDFGIALLAGHSGHTGGTPAYMAPEQWQGAPATPATDVYAATCVFFLCVTGFRPFTDTDTERLRQAHQFAPPPVERVPPPVRALVARGMAKDVGQRPAGAAAFVTELEKAAVAGYGKNWESTGWQRLAGFAGALLAVSPMAWLVSSTGVLGSTAAATGAVGTVATGAAAKSAAGVVAAKVAAAVVGVAVVAGAAVVVINTTADDPPAAAQEAFAVDTRAETASYQVNVDVSAQIVQVTGAPNADSLNAALRKPVDDEITEVRDSVDSIRNDLREYGDERWDTPVTIDVSAKVLLQNPNYLSVRYENNPTLGELSDSSWQSFDTVTVDLRTGKALSVDQVYRDGAAEALSDALVEKYAPELCPTISTGDTRVDITEESLGEYVVAAFTSEHAEFTIELSYFDRPTACGVLTYELPYADLTGVLRPELVSDLTGG